MAADIYMTQERYEKLVGELEYLKTVKRRQLAKAIGEARAYGDISENAEYDAAKDAQAHNEKEIMELEDKLSRVRILDKNIPKDQVLIGAKVKLLDMDTQEELEYTLVSDLEADYNQAKISVSSPVGSGLLGHKVNEVAEIKIPAGILKYKIIEITR